MTCPHFFQLKAGIVDLVGICGTAISWEDELTLLTVHYVNPPDRHLHYKTDEAASNDQGILFEALENHHAEIQAKMILSTRLHILKNMDPSMLTEMTDVEIVKALFGDLPCSPETQAKIKTEWESLVG